MIKVGGLFAGVEVNYSVVEGRNLTVCVGAAYSVFQVSCFLSLGMSQSDGGREEGVEGDGRV